MDERIRTHVSLSWLTIGGFACFLASLYGAFYMGTNRAIAVAGIQISRGDLVVMLAFMVAGFAVLEFSRLRRMDFESHSTLIGFAAVMLSLGAAIDLAPFADASIIGLVRAAFLGLPAGLFFTLWARLLAGSTPRVAASHIFAATGFAGALCFAVSFAPAAVQTGFSVAFPLASLVLYYAAFQLDLALNASAPAARAFSSAAPSEVETRVSPSPVFGPRMIVGMALFGLAAGVVETLRSIPGSPSTPALASSLFILALFSIAVLQSLLTGQPDETDDFSNAYRIAILVMLSGFLLMPVVSFDVVTGDSIILGGYLGLLSVFMALFGAMAHVSGELPDRVVRRGLLALYAGEAAGVIAANAVAALAGSAGHEYMAYLSAFAGVAVVFACLFLITQQDVRDLSAVVDDRDPATLVCMELADRAALSERETEVLALALRGHTNEKIANELFVAKSTVDSHLRRIYQKCGVHSRQELIDTAESLSNQMKRR